jgi:fatty acid CoA ligase FadD22
MRGPSPDANLAELLSQWTGAFGWDDRPAFLCGDDVYTHGEVHRGAARAAGLLAVRGAVPGDRVVIALPGSIDFVWAFLGVVRIGAIAMLADPDASALPVGELAVCAAGRHKRAITSAELTAGMPHAGFAEPYPVIAETPAFAQYSRMYVHGDPETSYLEMESLKVRQDDVLFSVPKMWDPAGLHDTVFLTLFSGASAVLESGRLPVSSVAERVRRHRVSILLSTPAFFTRVAADGAGETFEPLRMAVSHGTAPPPRRAAQRLGCPVVTPWTVPGGPVTARG